MTAPRKFDQHHEARRLRSIGLSYSEIARKLNTYPSTVIRAGRRAEARPATTGPATTRPVIGKWPRRNGGERSEESESQLVTTRCLFCDWIYVGELSDGRDGHRAHRADKHPELVERPKRRRRGRRSAAA